MNIPLPPNSPLRLSRHPVRAIIGMIAIATVFALDFPAIDKGDPVIPTATAAVAMRSKPHPASDSRQGSQTPSAENAVLRLLILERAGTRPFGSLR